MKRVYNFSPGPAMLPWPVLERVQKEMFDWQGRGVSLLEVSHRGEVFSEIVTSLKQRIRRLLSVPDTHEILLCAGGASTQFAAIPLNLAADQAGAYIVSGHWSRKALVQARYMTEPYVVTDNANHDGVSFDPQCEWDLPNEAAYLYYTDNETVNGVLLPSVPGVPYPVVCDMTSSLMTETIDYSCHDLIVASAQKNLGVSGLTVLIIRKDLCERKAMPQTPNTVRYNTLLKSDSLSNTPCTFAWYVADLVCEWVEQEGGIAEMHARKKERAKTLYDYLDSSDFYTTKVDPAYRSNINVVFQLRDESLLDQFLAEAKTAGFHALKGHRAVGGCRASMYNAMPVEGAYALVEFMKNFSEKCRAS